MNGLYLVIISALVLVLGYRFYGAFIAAKVLTVNQYKSRPPFVLRMVTTMFPLTNTSYSGIILRQLLVQVLS